MVLEKDLGTSLLLYASFLVMVYIATERFSWVAIGLTLFAAGSVVAYHLFAHVRVRVQTWAGSVRRPRGRRLPDGAVAVQLRHRGIFGTGLGNGQPGTVPAASTDFIIAAVGEELGLVGLAGVLLLYTILIVRGLRTAIAVRDSFGKLLAAGLALHPGHPAVHRRRRCHRTDPADRADHTVDVLRRFVTGGQLSAAGDPGEDLPCRAAADHDQPAHPDRGGQHRGDRARMNTSLRRISIMIMALIVLLLVNATVTQVFRADGLRADPRNQRVLLDEYSRQRGQITAGGQLLAYSVSTSGHYRFLRVFPNPFAYAPVTGFYSLRYSSSGLERAEDTILTAPTSACSAAGWRTSSPAAIRAAATSTRRSSRGCSRPHGMRCSRAATGRARARWWRWSRPPARSWRWCPRRRTTPICWPPTTPTSRARPGSSCATTPARH